jgi:hypothetical protein
VLPHLQHAEHEFSKRTGLGPGLETEIKTIAVTTEWRYNISGVNEELLLA